MNYYHVQVRELVERITTYGVHATNAEEAQLRSTDGLVLSKLDVEVKSITPAGVRQLINGRLVKPATEETIP